MNKRDVNKLKTQCCKIEEVIDNLTKFNTNIDEQINGINDDAIIDELNMVYDMIDIAMNFIKLGKEEIEEMLLIES